MSESHRTALKCSDSFPPLLVAINKHMQSGLWFMGWTKLSISIHLTSFVFISEN